MPDAPYLPRYHTTAPKKSFSLAQPHTSNLIYGDGLPYHGFLRSFSLADLPTLEWNKLGGLAIFILMPSFAPFEDEPPFLSHKTIVKQLVSLLRYSKKNNKVTTIWLAYCSRSNVADCEFASILDRRIDIIPALSFLYVTVVCSIVHLAYRHPDTHEIVEHPDPLDYPLILMHLSSIPLPKQHVPRTIEFYPKCMPDVVPGLDLYVPTPSLFQLRIDIPSRVTLEVEGNEVVWDITGTLPLILLLNGLSPDDTSTVLKDIVAPKITKEFWPVVVNASPEGYKIFNFHVPIHILSRFYDEQEALAEMDVSLGLLHSSVKQNSIVISHQPRFVKNAPKKRKMPSNEVRDAVQMNSTLRKKFTFLVLLNKYDVLGMVHDPMLIQPAVQEIENFGDMIVVSATTQQRMIARDITRNVSPPHVLIRFPPTLAIPDVLRSSGTFGPVETHQLFQQSGMLLVKYQSF